MLLRTRNPDQQLTLSLEVLSRLQAVFFFDGFAQRRNKGSQLIERGRALYSELVAETPKPQQ
jgi:hypothetical protein